MCASYYHLQLHEASIIMDPPQRTFGEGEGEIQVQHVFDNTDHNVATLDGHMTYHCLGGIAIYTPEFLVKYSGYTKKLKSIPSAAELASQNVTHHVPFVANSNGLENIQYVDTETLGIVKSEILPSAYATYLWAKHCAISGIPSWRGFMEYLSSECNYSVSKVICLPFINEYYLL